MRLAVFQEFIGLESFRNLPANVIPNVNNFSISPASAEELNCLKHNAKLFYSENEIDEVSSIIQCLEKLGYSVKEREPKTSERPKAWIMEGRVILEYLTPTKN